MMAFECWHLLIKINQNPRLYVNTPWFNYILVHSDCMEYSGITTYSDICYTLILMNMDHDMYFDTYKMQWCSLTPRYTSMIHSYIICTFWNYNNMTRCHILTHYLILYNSDTLLHLALCHISIRQLTLLWLILTNMSMIFLDFSHHFLLHFDTPNILW